jgi:hypothetical protein
MNPSLTPSIAHSLRATHHSPQRISFQHGALSLTNNSTINIGEINKGESAEFSLAIHNDGDLALSISEIVTTGDFMLQGNAPTEIAPDQNAVVTFTSNTSTAGSKSGQVVVRSNDEDESTFTLNLSASVVIVTSSDDILIKSDITINPNPGKDVYQLKTNEGNALKNIVIRSVTGQVMLVIENPDGIVSFSLADKPAGVYLALITTDTKTLVKRIVHR